MDGWVEWVVGEWVVGWMNEWADRWWVDGPQGPVVGTGTGDPPALPGQSHHPLALNMDLKAQGLWSSFQL